MGKYILSIDQGTTGSTVAIVNTEGKIVIKVNNEYPQIFPQPGWVEHDPEEIWRSVLTGIGQCLQRASISSKELVAIGITNQRETVVAWDRQTGQALYNAIVWQCRRTAKVCSDLKKKGLQPVIQRRTGLLLDPYFSASKMQWILKNIPEAKAQAKLGNLCFGTIDSFLIWRLTGGKVHATDVSNASRTMLMNIESGDWDNELLKIFSVPRSSLPEIMVSSGEFGRTVDLGAVGPGVAITGVAGDQQAALFGQLCFRPGEAKCTFGTGSFLLLNTGTHRPKSKSGCLATVAWQLDVKKPMIYALEGGAFICGAAVQWLRDGLNFFSHSSEVEDLARSVQDTGGLEFVPALSGLGTPYWDPNARGLICGITRGTTKAHIARATLESMALQNVDVLHAMQQDIAVKLKSVKVDGGATSNNLLMQLQANYLGVPIVRPKMIESTVLGAAYLAGLGCGIWQNQQELEALWQEERTFIPEMSKVQRQKRLASWHQAIERTLLGDQKSAGKAPGLRRIIKTKSKARR